jgi:diacylglycerol kinase (ATP)
MQKKDPFVQNRLKSVGYAFKGMIFLIRTEASIQIQVVIALVVTLAGIYFNLSPMEWMIQVAMIGLVMSIEAVNTAIEYIADFVHPEHHKKIGLIKDISAGAVFIASVVAVVIALIIYIPKLL